MPLLFLPALPALAPIAIGLGKAIVGGAVASVAGHAIGKGVKKYGGKPGNALAKFWDTHIGRKGLIGEGGEMLGLWESGTTKDRKGRAKNAVYGLMEEEEKRFEKRMDMNDMELANNMLNTNMKSGGLIGKMMNSGNTATDNSRNVHINRVIANTLRTKNMTLNQNIQKKLNIEQAHDNTMSNYDAQIDQIENS